MSCRVGWKTASGRHSSHSATSSSRMSCRRSGNVRTSKSCTVRFSGAMPSSAVAAMLAVALIPGHDLKRFVTPATHLAALIVGLLVIGAAAWVLVRYPAAVPVVLLAAAPFRISTSVGTQTAYLLDPLYVVLAAALVALVVRTVRGYVGRPLPRLLALPAAAFVLFAGISFLWTKDLRQGSIELLFFLFPFSALVVAVVKSPFRAWHPRALAATLVALAVLL